MMVAGLNLMASQQVFIAISRICTKCIIGLGLLDMLPIGTTTTKLIR